LSIFSAWLIIVRTSGLFGRTRIRTFFCGFRFVQKKEFHALDLQVAASMALW